MKEKDIAKSKHELKTPLFHCLKILLKNLKWHGEKRQLAEALPHFGDITNVEAFCEVMNNLHYEHDSLSLTINELDKRLLPCLFITETGKAFIILNKSNNNWKVFNGENREEQILKSNELSGTAHFFKSIKRKKIEEKPETSFFRSLFTKYKKLIYNTLFLSFILNLLALATPLFIMGVYNHVIGSESFVTLRGFLIGIVIAVISIIWLSKLRNYILVYLGTRLDFEVGNEIFERLMYLSPSYTETATVGEQVAQIKDFNNVREFLTGPMITVLFDFPFILVFLIAIAAIGGNLVLIPLVMIGLYALLAITTNKSIRRKTKHTTQSAAKQQEFLLETLHNMSDIKHMAIEDVWQERYRNISAISSMANLKTTLASAINNAVTDAIMIGSGMAILCAGVFKVLGGNLSIGGLIATMILVWRVLAPLKMLYITYPKLQQIVTSLQQIHKLLGITPEADPAVRSLYTQPELKGFIRFDRVSFRYPNNMTPALLGISFQAQPGSLVAIVGRNGSGKSTLLKLLLSLYQPQAGKIYIDQFDIRQLNPIQLRQAFNYVPQDAQFFYGTIAQNLRLADPTADDQTLIQAAKRAQILTDIEKLPEGFNTRLRDRSGESLASSFQQRLNLARGYLKPASILLLDEPAMAFDVETDQAFINSIAELKGKMTIFMVTHRPSHLKLADKILLLEQGQLILQGPHAEVMPRISPEAL